MRALKITGAIIAGLIVLLLVIAAALPSNYRVERSVEIHKPADVIYALVVNLPNWPKWDPFTEKNPAMKSKFNGEPGAIGSKWEWEGGEETGRMTVEEVIANRSIRSKLEFFSPQAMVASDNWDFTPTANGTKVTWAVGGDLDYPIGRLFGLFMDSMLGPTFEKGLANLKTVSEQTESEVTSLSDVSPQ
jgi:hypothetical protein